MKIKQSISTSVRLQVKKKKQQAHVNILLSILHIKLLFGGDDTHSLKQTNKQTLEKPILTISKILVHNLPDRIYIRNFWIRFLVTKTGPIMFYLSY